MHILLNNISLRFSSNSEANYASELLENLEEMFNADSDVWIMNKCFYGTCHQGHINIVLVILNRMLQT